MTFTEIWWLTVLFSLYLLTCSVIGYFVLGIITSLIYKIFKLIKKR